MVISGYERSLVIGYIKSGAMFSDGTHVIVESARMALPSAGVASSSDDLDFASLIFFAKNGPKQLKIYNNQSADVVISRQDIKIICQCNVEAWGG
jgi:hypothetical protein